MSRSRIFTVFLIALLAGGGLAYGTYDYLQNVPVKTVTVPTKKVVIANADIALGSELRRDDLTTVEWPANAVPEGAFDDPAGLVGRGLIDSVVRHEVILTGKLASKEAGSGLPPIIPQGMRAMSVRVDEVIGVAGFVVPGTKVDVVVTVRNALGNSQAMSRIVLSDVLVLTAGTRLDQEQAKDGQPQRSTVVTLALSPPDAEKVALAASEGRISLALRNPLDTTPTQTNGVQVAALMSGSQAAPVVPTPGSRPAARRSTNAVAQAVAAPPPPKPTVYTVEAIRAAKRSEEVVR